jgi:hypothetical protein
VAVSTPTPSAVTPHYPGDFTNWTTFKANGVNLGGWLEQEQVFDQTWWNSHAPDAADEWSFCETLGRSMRTRPRGTLRELRDDCRYR